MKKGTLFIVSAPSGAGKTSLVKRLVAEMDNISVSVSHTTRMQRPGEINGSDYYFVDQAEFENMLRDDAFLEYAQVFDHCYGTARSMIDAALANSGDLILEIDWQGAQQVGRKIVGAVSIFILPPSEAALAERLRNRGQDDPSIIVRRMHDAHAEMSHYNEYDYLVVNDDFDQALQELKCIVTAARLETKSRAVELADLISALVPRE